jgi:hypothetical protein
MDEPDDRLAGDPSWELFPHAPTPSGTTRRFWYWADAVVVVVLASFLSPPVAVIAACFFAAHPDLRAGRQLSRSIPDIAIGAICSRLRYAWGAWKSGGVAFTLMFVTAYLDQPAGGKSEASPAFITAILLWLLSFAASATLTASSLLAAYRSGMKVWLGEGLNQARLLLLGMLLAGVALGMLVPMTLWFVGKLAHAGDGRGYDLFF